MALARWLETDSLSNQNISSALAIGAYTAATDRMIVCDVSLDQVAGGGDYVVYVTRQINGTGSIYVMLPKTTCTAAAGETAIAMQSGPITVRAGDVLTVYVDGLAGDTTTPDTTVRWFEMATLRPTSADRTLDVAATGEAGVDLTNRLDTTGILPSVAAGASGGLPVLDANLAASANVTYLKSTALTETAVGRLAAALVKLLDVATPVLTAESVNQSGDGYAVVNHATYGNAKLARTGADADTLETLSDQIDGVSTLTAQNVRDAMKLAPTAGTPADGSVDDHLDDLATALATATVTVVSAVDGDEISIYQAVSLSATISGLSIPASWTKIYWTVKRSTSEADADAILQIVETNPGAGTDGLLRLNGAAGTAANGSLTVDQAAGTVVIALDDGTTDDLALATGLVWSLKALYSTSSSQLLAVGTVNVLDQATLAVA